METCLCCKGKKTVLCTIHDCKIEEMELPCQWCHGKGFMTEEEYKSYQSFLVSWCECDVPGDPEYFKRANGSHGYICSKCKKFIQIG
jgi:hypothetical protein